MLISHAPLPHVPVSAALPRLLRRLPPTLRPHPHHPLVQACRVHAAPRVSHCGAAPATAAHTSRRSTRVRVLVDPVVEAAQSLEKQLAAQQEAEGRPTPDVPSGGDPWEDKKWQQYKWWVVQQHGAARPPARVWMGS